MNDLPPIRQAREDVDLRYLVRVGLVSVAIAIGSVLFVYAILRGRGDVGAGGASRVPNRTGRILERSIEAPPHPAAREAPAELERYGWADRDAGVATIPIRRAMEIVAERGR